MPKSTFYRLSEEKQQRILEAAKQEFLRVPFQEASINKIIKAAEIPRGSFYQYFQDKEDIFLYAISEQREKISNALIESLQKCDGNFFRFIYCYIDKFQEFCRSGEYGRIMLTLADHDTAQMVCSVVHNMGDCESEKNAFEKEMKKVIDFSMFTLEEREEQIYLLNIIGAVLRESMYRIMHETDYEEVKKICDNMKERIHFLERHFTKNIESL